MKNYKPVKDCLLVKELERSNAGYTQVTFDPVLPIGCFVLFTVGVFIGFVLGKIF